VKHEWKALTITELNPLSFEISLKRENYRVILVEWRTINSNEGVDSGKFLNKSMKITLELNCTVPWLKRKPIKVSGRKVDYY
jgi:hypothetical protein